MSMNRNLRSLVEGKKKDWTVGDWEDKQDGIMQALSLAKEGAASALNRATGMQQYGFSAKENYDEATKLAVSVGRLVALLQSVQSKLAEMREQR